MSRTTVGRARFTPGAWKKIGAAALVATAVAGGAVGSAHAYAPHGGDVEKTNPSIPNKVLKGEVNLTSVPRSGYEDPMSYWHDGYVTCNLYYPNSWSIAWTKTWYDPNTDKYVIHWNCYAEW